MCAENPVIGCKLLFVAVRLINEANRQVDEFVVGDVTKPNVRANSIAEAIGDREGLKAGCILLRHSSFVDLTRGVCDCRRCNNHVG